jgi:hypothetical protein
MKLLSWSTGKKTYITVAVGIAVGAAQAYGLHIPSWVNWLLTFAGIGFTRSAVTGQSQAAVQALQVLITDVLSQVSQPTVTVSNTAATETTPATTVTKVEPSTPVITSVPSGVLTPEQEIEVTRNLNKEASAGSGKFHG